MVFGACTADRSGFALLLLLVHFGAHLLLLLLNGVLVKQFLLFMEKAARILRLCELTRDQVSIAFR